MMMKRTRNGCQGACLDVDDDEDDGDDHDDDDTDT